MSTPPLVPQMRAVVFDAGETLFDETRMWETWADWLNIPRLTFMGVLGATIAQGRHHNEVFEILRPGLDLDSEISKRLGEGAEIGFTLEDLYPDALPTIKALKARGYLVGVAGNQPSGFTSALSSAGMELDLVTTSGDMGHEKPDQRFFHALAEMLRLPASAIAYVGDRLDNDVYPAEEAGMLAIFIRRGPWAHIQAETEPTRTSIRSLAELPFLLEP